MRAKIASYVETPMDTYPGHYGTCRMGIYIGLGTNHQCYNNCCIFYLSACAEGITLGLHSFDKMKSKNKEREEPTTRLIRLENHPLPPSPIPHIHTHTHIFHSSTDSSLVTKWDRGCILGSTQNFARELMESPANHMTPTMFVEAVSNKLGRMRHSLTNPSSLQLVPRYH